MSVVGRAFFVLAMSVLSVFLPQTALAEHVVSQTQEITVSAIVLAHRTIVVDSSGQIMHIISNTNDQIVPEVRLLDENGPTLPLSFSVSRDYLHLLSQVGTNQVMMMQRQTSVWNGFIPRLLLSDFQQAYTVTTMGNSSNPNRPFTIYQ